MSSQIRSDFFHRFAPFREGKSVRTFFLVSIGITYAVSLCLPAMDECGGSRLVTDYHAACGNAPAAPGIAVLVLGSIALLLDGLRIACGDTSWAQSVTTILEQLAVFGVLANVGIAMTVTALLRKRRPPLAVAFASLGLALLSQTVIGPCSGFSGCTVEALDASGYWAWVMTNVLTLAAAILVRAPGEPSLLAKEADLQRTPIPVSDQESR